MAKAVFRPGEVVLSEKKVVLQPPEAFAPFLVSKQTAEQEDELPEVEEYAGPTADDLRR